MAGSAVNASQYTLSGTTLTFASPPTGAITDGFNSEIDVISDQTIPSVISLPASGNNADTGFQVDTSAYNVVIMDYTIENNNGVRIGQLRFGTDTVASTSTIDDQYTETAAVGITFGVDISVSSTMKLQYTDTSNLISKLKYSYQLWNSN